MNKIPDFVSHSLVPAPVFIVLVFLLGCNSSAEKPHVLDIVSVEPSSGTAGRLVALNAKNLPGVKIDYKVEFNGTEARIINVVLPGPLDADLPKLNVEAPENGSTGPVTIATQGSTTTGPVYTYLTPKNTAYYIRFKADGVLKEFQKSDQAFSSCEPCICSTFQTTAEFVLLRFCDAGIVVRSTLESWKGTTFQMRDNGGFPKAQLIFNSSGVFWDSNVLDDFYTTAEITEVTYNASSNRADAYDVKGTFGGLIEAVGGPHAMTISDGEFLLRFVVSAQ